MFMNRMKKSSLTSSSSSFSSTSIITSTISKPVPCTIHLRDGQQPGCLRCGVIPLHYELLNELIRHTPTCRETDVLHPRIAMFRDTLFKFRNVVKERMVRTSLLRFTISPGEQPLFVHLVLQQQWNLLHELYEIGYPWDLCYQEQNIYSWMLVSLFRTFQPLDRIQSFFTTFHIPFNCGQSLISFASRIRREMFRASGDNYIMILKQRRGLLQFICENGFNPKDISLDWPKPHDSEMERNEWIKSLTSPSKTVDKRVWIFHHDELQEPDRWWCRGLVTNTLTTKNAKDQNEIRALVKLLGGKKANGIFIRTIPLTTNSTNMIRPLRPIDQSSPWLDDLPSYHLRVCDEFITPDCEGDWML